METHPHKPFVPENATILILGSFPPSQHTVAGKDEWFYESRYNQFWKIMRDVYHRPLETVAEKKKLFAEKGIAIADIFLEITRTGKSNSDQHLKVIEYNDEALKKIFGKHNIKSVFFTSKFVEKHFSRLFPNIKGTSLPSPSPRYAKMSLGEKINVYRERLPQ